MANIDEVSDGNALKQRMKPMFLKRYQHPRFLLLGSCLICSFLLAACTSNPTSNPGSNSGHMQGGGTGTAITTSSATRVPGKSTSWSLISRGVPSFASSEYYPASYANDESYDTVWRSQETPAWLAYDLSKVPFAKREKVLLVWYNESYNYDHTLISFPAYNMPQDYRIDVNPAPGGGQPPLSGWVTLVKVRGNHYHSRQHLITMAGDNWLRINVTAADGSPQNYDISINMDVYDVSGGTVDDWIFFGDSITAGAMSHVTVNGVKSFAQLISAAAHNAFPAQEDGGTGYLKSADGAKYIDTWLALFPGKYVVLSYGTNDALGCVNPQVFYNNYTFMVRAVLQDGKIPVVPHFPWAKDANIQSCGPRLNAQIDALYKAFPRIIKGPDLWAAFRSHQSLISNDTIHPNDEGYAFYRDLWANAMFTAVYSSH